MADPRETPAMQQYYRFKRAHPGCVLMFRIGDFYEMFDEDAVAVSKAIGLTLTQRTEGMPMCGVPFHQLETYLRRLILAGFRVAVCEQLADASQVKGLVPRGVMRVVTPGTAVDESLLASDAVNTLAAVIFTQGGDDSPASLAIVEVSTGDFKIVDCSAAQLIDELARRGTRELLYADTGTGSGPPPRVRRLLDSLGISGTARPSWQFRLSEASESLREHFAVKSFAGFGLREDEPAVQVAGAIVRYLRETQTLNEEDAKAVENFTAGRATLKHLRPPRREDTTNTCIIDAVSLRSLEIERTIRPVGLGGGKRRGEGAKEIPGDGSLLGIFIGSGCCRTGMGQRLLREYLCRPLRDVEAIKQRQRCVHLLVEERVLAGHVVEWLDKVQDVMRIAGRISMARATPRDLVGIAHSIHAAHEVSRVLEGAAAFASLRGKLAGACERSKHFADAIVKGCVENPPPHLREGGLFKDGVDAELDECRGLQRDAGQWLSEYQAQLMSQYNLPSLKVGYNSVFGYYIELPAAQAKSAPPELVRKQTLKNAERFTTPQLREYEGKVMSAQQRGLDRERAMFNELCAMGAKLLDEIGVIGEEIATLDVLSGFAEKAVKRSWKCPEMVNEQVLRIDNGRHPVLEEALGNEFVPNDVMLGSDEAAPLALITGPNMAGKSTYIRQTALIAILAHTGSFVPADRATVGVVDRVFTRIGADDALHAGQSTFMVEMIETANILNHATPRSLVVLDEVGRGTSTLDGLSLAWAIVEHLASQGPRTLFATHYHELTDLEERLAGKVKNLHVSVREWIGGSSQGDGEEGGEAHSELVFLHRILPGKSDQSYGLHVARLAGIPRSVVSRGREVLASLAVQHTGVGFSIGTQSGATDSTVEARASVEHVNGESNGNASLQSSRKGRLSTTGIAEPVAKGSKRKEQLSLFTEFVPHPAVDALREVKIEALSPMQAFDTLRRLKELASDD